jgi:hypothetical protein
MQKKEWKGGSVFNAAKIPSLGLSPFGVDSAYFATTELEV